MTKKKKKEREREKSISKLSDTIKYIFHYNYSMPYCAAVGCSNNSFRKNREKGYNFL